MRYRDLDHIDLDAAKEKVRQWMLAHPDGTPDQMVADLKDGYPQFPDHMAVVLRGPHGRLPGPPRGTGPRRIPRGDPVTKRATARSSRNSSRRDPGSVRPGQRGLRHGDRHLTEAPSWPV